jgi:transcriptional regulator with XRE-family HTH domain
MRVKSAEDLGAVVRGRRRELGLTQAELADRADVTRQWLIRFERGDSDTSLVKAFAVLRALELVLRTDAAHAQDGSGSRSTFKIPRIDMPRIDLSGIDWAAVSRALDARSLEASSVLADLRAGMLSSSDVRRDQKPADHD